MQTNFSFNQFSLSEPEIKSTDSKQEFQLISNC